MHGSRTDIKHDSSTHPKHGSRSKTWQQHKSKTAIKQAVSADVCGVGGYECWLCYYATVSERCHTQDTEQERGKGIKWGVRA